MSETLTAPAASETDISDLLLRPDVQTALITVLEGLPKIAPLIGLLGKGVDAAREVMTDGDLLESLETVVMGKARPAQAKVQDVVSRVKEAQHRAEHRTDTIGVFGLMKMLKDPTVQKGLRFVQSFLELSAEQKPTR